ncbi:CpaF family protein [Candidatus Sumerlaeota bacterium]|nr:CpaF family protein [Candidatus Sumerlaeota bacterium]
MASSRLANTEPAEHLPFNALGDKSAEASPGSYHYIKHLLHQQILRRLDISTLDPERDRELFNSTVLGIIQDTLADMPLPLSRKEKDRLAEDTLAEAVGLGPLGPLFADPAVSDILVNGPYEVYVERFGRLESTEIKFHNVDHLMNLIERIVSRVGRHIDQNSPMVDARLPDGSRVNAIIPPLSLSGPVLSIRRFGQRYLETEDLIRLGTATPEMMKVFEGLVQSRHNIQISGGTGSGKTTLLNVLSSHISPKERVITIEDAAELKLQKSHVVRLESRPPNIEGRGQVTIRDLVINALRMRPDRIIVGEVRGGEAFDMIQAMSTGHEGGMTTIHANSTRDATNRLEAQVLLAGFDLPSRVIRQMIASALDVLIHVERLPDGSRKVVSVSEFVGIEQDTILMQEIFTFERQGMNAKRVVGRHVATGVKPNFLRKCEQRGVKLDPALFQKGQSS